MAVDYVGAHDGGATYVIGGAEQLKGAEIETVRRRLFRTMPTWTDGYWVEDGKV